MGRVSEAADKNLGAAMKEVDWERAYQLADDLARVFAPVNGAAREWIMQCLDHPECVNVMAPNVQEVFGRSSSFLVVGVHVGNLMDLINDSFEGDDEEDPAGVANAEESPAAD